MGASVAASSPPQDFHMGTKRKSFGLSRPWVATAVTVKRGLEAQRHGSHSQGINGKAMTAFAQHGGQSRVEEL